MTHQTRHIRRYSSRQLRNLNYLATLEDEMDTRDYASPRYRGEGEGIRAADLAFMTKVRNAINTDSDIFGPAPWEGS
jgi:hypothetical protein